METQPTLTRSWSWTKLGWKYYSPELDMEFETKEEFWFWKGANSWQYAQPTSKVRGFHMEQIIADWVESHCVGKPCVVLYDINVEIKHPAFWLKIPKDRVVELTKDVVVLYCDSTQEMEDLLQAIDPLFASSLGFTAEGYVRV